MVDFGAAAGSRPVTWLVDPAVTDTVRDLVAGNPPRSLDSTVTDAGGGDGSPEPTAEAEPDGAAVGDSRADSDPDPDPHGDAAQESHVAFDDRMEDWQR